MALRHGALTGTQLRLLIFLITALLLPCFAHAGVSLERRGPMVIVGNGRINLQIHLDGETVDYLPSTRRAGSMEQPPASSCGRQVRICSRHVGWVNLASR